MRSRKTYYTVCILGQALQSQKGVVRLDHNVGDFVLVRKNGIRLDQLLWKPGINENRSKGHTKVTFNLNAHCSLASDFSDLSYLNLVYPMHYEF